MTAKLGRDMKAHDAAWTGMVGVCLILRGKVGNQASLYFMQGVVLMLRSGLASRMHTRYI